MFLQYFQRGEVITAEKLNRLIDAIRQSALQSGPGYTVQQSPAGTTIAIASQGGGGGGANGELCEFLVSDISEIDEEGNPTILKVSVAPSKIGGTDYPQYMDEKTAIDFSIRNDTEGWYAVYILVNVDNYNNVITDGEGEDAKKEIYVVLENDYRNSTSFRQYTFVAGVTVSADQGSGFYISDISNACPTVTPWDPPACPFIVEDYSDPPSNESAPCEVSIRSGKIDNEYPSGMSMEAIYSLTLNADQDWWAIYCNIVYDADFKINHDEGGVTFSQEKKYQEDVEGYARVLIAEVNIGYNADGARVIDYISNMCQVPFVTTSAAGSGGTCHFRVSDASTKSGDTVTPKLKIDAGFIDGKWPTGMGMGYPDYVFEGITEDCYIYAVLKFKANDVILDTAPNSITFTHSTELLESTTDEEKVLVAAVYFLDGLIKKITNVCLPIIPNPCNLNWTQPPDTTSGGGGQDTTTGGGGGDTPTDPPPEDTI